MSFSSDIAGSIEKAQKAATAVFRGSALEILSGIIHRTPVKTGRLRGNWQATLNTMASGEVDGSGQRALSTANRVTSKAEITDSVYMVNNLPYAKAIEDGHSQNQAPRGMVKITIAEFKRIVANNANKAKR